jgi:hypothetical protein
MEYLWVFLASLAVDLVPIIGPPAWTVMVLLLVRFDLNPWLVLAAGVPASVIGRYVLSLYTPWLFKKIIRRKKSDEFEFVGRKLQQRLWQSWSFVFVYSVSPLPTTPLFSAGGLAKVSPLHIIPPFFVGKFISDAVMLLTGRSAVTSLGELLKGTYSAKGVAVAAVSLLVICAFLFLDWRQLIERRRLHFSVRIWK